MAAQTPTQRDRCGKPVAAFCGIAFLALGLMLSLAGCQTCPTCDSQAKRATAQELLQADKDFCALAQKCGVAEAFRAYAAEDATLLPLGENPVHGREAIFATMSEGSRYELEWSPEAADLARCGDLGYTWGKSVFRRTGEDGKPLVRHGKYLTVWRRQPDGSWRFVMDIGNPSPPPK
jgi:ketosteroid isomerase-like protein